MYNIDQYSTKKRRGFYSPPLLKGVDVMNKINLTEEQKTALKEGYEQAWNRAMSHGDQSVIFQSMGQHEGILFVLNTLGLTLSDLKND
jgi:hypothetical protein